MAPATPPPPKPSDVGRAYTKQLRWAAEIRFLTFFLAILAYGLLGVHKWSASSAQAITSNFYLQIALCWIALWVVCTVASLPVSLYRFFLDRKFRLVKSGVRHWLWDSLKANALVLVLGASIAEIAFVTNSLVPTHGWILAGVFCSLLFIVVNQSMPWLLSLFYPVVPLSNIPLHERLTRLASKANLQVGTISEWRISHRTRRANALVTGLGSARRILLTDTLIAELSEDEVEAVIAHELGHCALHHIRKRILLQSLVFSVIFYLINFAVRHDLVCFIDHNAGWRDLTLLPGFYLYWTCGFIYGTMLLSSLSRRQEKAADLYSWKLSGRSEPFISAMRKLTSLNLIVFDKNSQWKYMHPPTADRIAAAELYAKAQGETVAASAAAFPIGS